MEIRSTNTATVPQRMSERPSTASVAPQTAAQKPTAPLQTVDAVERPGEVPSMNQLDDAVQNINMAMKALSQKLEFTVDPDSDRTVVKVVDQQTQEVLRQLPSKEALEIAKALDRLQGLLISQKA